jgi:hypothetical protein
MKRPHYETAEHVKVETAQAKKVCERWKQDVRMVKLPERYYVDYAVLNNDTDEVVAWVEMRSRNNALTKFPDYQTAAVKLLHGVEFAEMYNIPFYLFVRFTDGDYAIRITREYLVKRKLYLMYLVSRGDPQDIEPCVSIDHAHLTPF